MKNLKLKMVLIIIGFAVLTAYTGQWEVFTNKNDVRDIALSSDGKTLWAATTGGVVAWNLNDNSYKSYTTLDGLLSCNINQVAVDKKGRPWVATINPAGLFVYENKIWKQINVGGANNDNEIKGIISGLEVDQFGNVWVYISNGLISELKCYLWRYDGQIWHKHEGVYGPLALDPQNNLLAVDSLFETNQNRSQYTLRFRIVSFNGSEFVSKWRSKVNAEGYWIALAEIEEDSKGNIWISYYSERMGGKYGVVCNDTIYNTLDGLADDNVRNIIADESGAVWCATDGGISKFTESGWVTYDTTKGIASNIVYRILIGSNNTNTLYAATSKGISILKSNQWKTLKTIKEPPHNNYKEIVVDKRIAVILSGGKGDHIVTYNDLQWKTNYFPDIRLAEGFLINKSFIKSKDGTGNLYAIGNEIENDSKGYRIKNGCILKKRTGESTFFKAFSAPGKNDRFLLPAVVSSNNDSYFWLTGEHDELILFDKQRTTIFTPQRLGVGRGAKTTCMMLDSDGKSVWVGYKGLRSSPPPGIDYSGGIVHFDGNTVKKRITEIDGSELYWVKAIARDSSENLWFAYLDKRQRGGVFVLRNTKLTKYIMDSNGKMFGGCYTLFVDKSGMVWTCSLKGIARFDGSSWKLFEDFPNLLPRDIIQDKSGTVWFGTHSKLLAYKDNRWYQSTTRDGLPCNSIRSLALDSKDNLWILTDNGIAMRKPGGMTHNQPRGDFMNPGFKQQIKRCGNQFYVVSKIKSDIMGYKLFDLRGRVIHRQTIHRKKYFVLPEKKFYIGSGLRILSITLENTDGSQNKYLFNIGNIKDL